MAETAPQSSLRPIVPVPPGNAPPLPASYSRAELEDAGFVGWQTWDSLRESDFEQVPDGPAAYVVYRPSESEPVFGDSTGGSFKGKAPGVEHDVLERTWVPNEHVVYIGKADRAKRRLREYARFGAGERVGHWGGRYIWQLADAQELLVAWHSISWDEPARNYEQRLLARFAELHGGRRPFANLRD